MITLLHTTMMLGLILLPLMSRKKDKTVVYKIDHDTTDAHYAINANGYLEEISGSKISGHYID